MKKLTQLSCSLLAGVLLVGCGGGSSSTTSGGIASTTAQVSVDAMTSVPVINGSATQGTLYVHNYGNTAASGVSFNLGSATAKTKVKAALAKVGLNFGGYEDANGFVLINPERCGSIPAGGSCAVNFTTPRMSVGNLGNSLVKLTYNGSNGSATTSQVVNYKYVDLAALSGVNFTGSLNITGIQGSTPHVVGYLYAGGASGTSYKDVNLNSTNATTRISNGFINGQEVVAGQVIAVEFAVAMQSNKTSAANVTPSWGSSKLQALSLDANSGSPLTLSLTPTQSTVNLIFGNIPVLSAPTTSAAVVNVVNNGNADSSGGLTATATGGNASDLVISNGCSSTVLTANAANSCQITFSTASYSSGTTTVEYKDNTSAVVGSQTVVWTNTQPFPAVYISPNPTTISFGKGQSTGTIVFTVTNVGKAPLSGVTYPVVNTGNATWSQESSTCSNSIGASASCAITGHLTGIDDGSGSFYIKALGSFGGVNYSFVALPVSYTVTSNPSLEITPTSASMTLLANGVESQSQTYTVKNIGNDPAIFTSLALTDSSTNAVKPVIVSGSGVGDCTSSTTLAENSSCSVVVKYGPAAASTTINESGIATLQVAYHGGTPDMSYNSQATLNYNLVGNDSYATESASVTNLTGAGTSGSPYAGNANLDPMKITLTYSNPSVNYSMSKFNLNTNGLPYGLTVDPSSTCKTGSETMSLESKGASCTLVLALDRSVLASIGGSVVLDFTTPTATWTTPLGFYSQAGTATYLTYAQPSVVFALSNNNASFESTVLSITGSNLDKGANPLPVSVAGVRDWLESSPVNPSAGCMVNPSTYAVSCNLTVANNVESVTYVMPNYLQTGESADILLLFSTTAYAYLNPSYTFINYLATIPAPPIVATIALPQSGQTPTAPISALAGYDGYTYFGVPWAYVTSGTTIPSTRFTVGTADEADCVTDNLTGLMWVKSPSSTTYMWRTGANPSYTYPAQAAVDVYNTNSYCGHSDWYLPTINDLASLLNDGYIGGTNKYQSEWLISQGFINVKSNSYYWSSSTDASSANNAWRIVFSFGSVNTGSKTGGNYVWPVRRSANVVMAPAKVAITGESGGAAGSDSGVAWPSPRFVAKSSTTNDCITDKLTGLMWPKNGIIGFESTNDGGAIAQPDYANTTTTLNQINWTDALTAVANMNTAPIKLCGYSDWRLPNKVELKSLVNYGAANPANWLMYGSGNSGAPACDGACFANVQAGSNYWSSSTYASSATLAWVVYFFNGNVTAGGKTTSNYVWPVRGGQ